MKVVKEEKYKLAISSLVSCLAQSLIVFVVKNYFLKIRVTQCMNEWKPLSHVWLFATPWTVAHQTPLFMEFFRQEYWSG